MPAAYTHRSIADRALKALSGGVKSASTVSVGLPVYGKRDVDTLEVPSKLVDLLSGHASSFRAGAIGPDFFPDVLSGITASHQPNLRGRTLSDFMAIMASSARDATPEQVAFAFGWLSHICADVFGHHWVNMESGDDFVDWLKTPFEVIRKHLGIEKLWDEELRRTMPAVKEDFKLDVGFIRKLTLMSGSSLCTTFYEHKDYENLYALCHLGRLATWHAEQAEQAKRYGDSMEVSLLTDNCPLCRGAAAIDKRVSKKCPTCKAVGQIAENRKVKCAVCKAVGSVENKCSTCNAAGIIEQSGKRSFRLTSLVPHASAKRGLSARIMPVRSCSASSDTHVPHARGPRCFVVRVPNAKEADISSKSCR
jgi:hypothetical protein